MKVVFYRLSSMLIYAFVVMTIKDMAGMDYALGMLAALVGGIASKVYSTKEAA